MLSESTRRGHVAYGSTLLPLLHARGGAAQRVAMGAGATAILFFAALVPLLPADLSITVLFLIPVVGVSWYAGRWPGTLAAFAAAGTRLIVDLGAGVPYSTPAVPYWNFAIGLTLFLLAARVLPGLSDAVYRDRELAVTDPLTNLGNRKLFGELAAIELNRTRRYRRPLVLAYVNVDAFEKFNERHGYAEGDALLVLIASVIRGCLRTSDVVARIAADDFAVLLPETHADGARVAVDKIHQNLKDAAARAGYAATFSIAVVTYTEGPVALDGALRQADALMSDAKRAGGDTVLYGEYTHPLVSTL